MHILLSHLPREKIWVSSGLRNTQSIGLESRLNSKFRKHLQNKSEENNMVELSGEWSQVYKLPLESLLNFVLTKKWVIV